MLQDTGWYVANFSRADRLDWGQNLGCDFATKSCKSWIDERRAKNMSIRPFCDRVKGDLLHIACSEDRASKAVCNMKHYHEPLPLAYRNFNQLDGVESQHLAHYGGSVDLADYCPFIQEFTWQVQNVTILGSRCDHGSNNFDSDRNAALEAYGPHTKCFEHGHRWEQRSCIYKRHWHHYGAGCYKYACQDGHFSIEVGNLTYPCYYGGQVIQVEQMVDQWLYNGTIVCPVCQQVCPAHRCKSFDRFIIDKIFSLNHHLGSLNDTVDEKLVKAMLEATDNSIVSNELEVDLLFDKQHSNKSSDNTIREFEIYKNHLQVMVKYPQHSKHSLICSNTNSLRPALKDILLISIVVIILDQYLRSRAFRWLQDVGAS